MTLEIVHAGGTEEWTCPTCGRRFLMDWPPNYKRVILTTGEENAVHTGSSEGITLEMIHINQEDNEAIDDPYLEPWQEWMDQVDFDSWWKPDH